MNLKESCEHVGYHQGKRLADKHGWLFIETSALKEQDVTNLCQMA